VSFENLLARELERALPLQREDGGHWDDVLQRAGFRRRRPCRLLAVAALVVVLGVAPAYAVGTRVVGYFEAEGSPVERAQLSERDLRILGLERGRGGTTAIEEIGNDGRRAYFKVEYADGSVCLASGDVGRGDRFTALRCGERLLPTAGRPITADVVVEATRADPVMRIWRVTGLAGDGVSRVALVDDRGDEVGTEVRGNVYTLANLPRRNFVAIVAYDAEGREVYREPIGP
jgi:hypothetical protein